MAFTSQNKELFEDYEGFVEKFKPKKTTDDCYTPPNIYEAVADWVAAEYGVDKADYIRPFYPGGDYKNADYSGKIVVDNPPFSILEKIIKFYVENNIKFFLFVPTLTCCRYGDNCTLIVTGNSIIYENGARINTSFATNFEPRELRARTAPSLYSAIEEANRVNINKQKKHVAEYVYPPDLLTTAMIYPFSRVGVDFRLPRAESQRVNLLDEQRGSGKAIFGAGWLISEKAKAEREKAEREKAEREKAEREKVVAWQLSEREREIVARLSQNSKTERRESGKEFFFFFSADENG